MSKLVGSLIGEKYLVLQHLGGGAMGDVYLAEHTGLGRQFAIKVLKAAFASDPVLLERFRREAHATSRLDHANIVYIADFGTLTTAQPYLVMEYVSGRTLRGELDALAPDVLPLPRVQAILEQVFAAVEVAHAASVVHRDLKPDNILISNSLAGVDLVKVLDFGVAKILNESGAEKLTRAGEMFGTPAYMAPEQATGRPTDHRSDLYSLGVIAYELVAGRPPFTHTSIPGLIMAHLQETPAPPSSTRPATAPPLPEPLESLILGCLAKDPGERPASASEVLATLGRTRSLLLPASPVSVAITREDAAHDGTDPGEWGEVSVEATFADIASTLITPGELLGRREAVPTGPAPDQPTWELAVSLAKHLAGQLEAIYRAPRDLLEAMTLLGRREQESQDLAAELLAAVTRRADIERSVRQIDAQLRHAIVDRREERRSLTGHTARDRQLASDLDYQIEQMEQRLAELYREQQHKQGTLDALIADRQTRLEQAQRHLVELQVALINLLHRCRPSPCPAPIVETYDRVARILHALA